MRIEIVADARALAMAAADAICGVAPAANIALPTGNTPMEAYNEVRARANRGEADLRGVTVWAIDEFAGLTRATPGTNSVYYRDHLNMPLKALEIPDPGALDPDAHIAEFADRMRAAGGIDLCVLGVGVNGHIAFNEPGSERDSRARAVDLAPETRRVYTPAFGSLDAVPVRGMTLGVADLLDAREIIVLAVGAHKAEIVRRAIQEHPHAALPATWLQSHDRVTWLLDEAAAAQLPR